MHTKIPLSREISNHKNFSPHKFGIYSKILFMYVCAYS